MGDARMSSGSEFQTVGASKAKLKPNCFRKTTKLQIFHGRRDDVPET